MMQLPIPTVETDRLRLRGPQPSDFEPMAAFFADAPRSEGFGGPLSRGDAWRWFALSIGHWVLHGYGFWTVETKADNTVIGIVGLWNPEGWEEPELGWVMYENGEGKGFAFEAAKAARLHAYNEMGMTTLTSNIVPGNTRSVTLAERLGAWFEKTYSNPHMGEDNLFRHPGPDDLGPDGLAKVRA